MATPRSDRSTQEILKEKFDKKEEAKKDKPKEERKLVIERTNTGLYYLRYDGGGQLPEALKGSFTSIDKLKALVSYLGKELA